MATTRERLHELLDEIPEDLLDDAEAAIAALVPPPYCPPEQAPLDDEPVTEEDLEAIRLGREEYRRGETIPHDQAMREIGLLVVGSNGAVGRSPRSLRSRGEMPEWPGGSRTR